MGREFLEFRVLRGHGWRKRELGDGGEICLGPGQAEGRFASINIVVEDIFFPDTPTLASGRFIARVSGWVREGFLAPRTKQRSSSLRDWIFAWPKVNCREKKSGR